VSYAKSEVTAKIINLREVTRTVYVSYAGLSANRTFSFWEEGIVVLDLVINNTGATSLTYSINNKDAVTLNSGVSKAFSSIFIGKLIISASDTYDVEVAGIETRWLGA
jgi:hypothetical protein